MTTTGARDPGVAFPETDGGRSTSALGRAVVADALRAVDPPGALAAEHETNWRSGYVPHFRRLVVSGLTSPEAARRIAVDGLRSLHDRMRVLTPDGGEHPLDAWAEVAPATAGCHTVEVQGTAAPETALSIPYRGERLRGDDLRRQLDAWRDAGVLEPSAVTAVEAVQRNPDWLRLEGRTMVALGAGAEMGPLQALLRWGATVAAVDLPSPHVHRRILRHARECAGTVLLPVASGGAHGDDDSALAQQGGQDLVADAPTAARWLTELAGDLVIGNYVYADGAANLRAASALDWLTSQVRQQRDHVALAFLATPTDVFAVPGDAVTHSVSAYEQRSRVGRLAGRPLRTLSGGRLLQRNYVPGTDPGLVDSMVAQQGPNYALSKRLHRWRATEARAAGATVSMNVAPPTRTRSVTKNRALAAAYAGAHRFGVEVFAPATSNVLMAALLVHDLHTDGGPAHEHPWQDEAHAAVHGGLWRAAYAPRSALGLAALLGVGAARG